MVDSGIAVLALLIHQCEASRNLSQCRRTTHGAHRLYERCKPRRHKLAE